MRRGTMRHCFIMGIMLALAACATAGGGVPQPDTATDRWRELLGCYAMGDARVALDSVRQTRLAAGEEPGIRQARFAPEPAIVGGYWFVTRGGVVWITRHDGLWGTTYELRVHGDSLVGRRHVRTDVPNARGEPVPAAMARLPSCGGIDFAERK